MRDALENVLKLGCFKGVPGRGNWKAIVEQLLLEMEVKGKKPPLQLEDENLRETWLQVEGTELSGRIINHSMTLKKATVFL